MGSVKARAVPEHFFEGLRYLMMSGVSASLSLGVPFILHESFAVRPDLAVAIGLTSAFVVNFFAAKLFVFRKKGSVSAQLSRYTLVSFLFRSGEYLCFLLLHNVLGIQYMIANTSVLTLSFCLKFFVYKIFVFAHRERQLEAVTGL